MAEQGKAYGSFKQSDWAKPELGDIDGQSGIYVGVIKEIVTGTRNGAVRVYIPVYGGDPDDSNGWLQCSYASPFLGSTPGYNSQLQLNNYDATRQTYGFFMTPPDVGNQVLCCFPPGRGSIGVWFACLTNNLSTYSIPAGAPSTSWENIDGISLQTGQSGQLSSVLAPGTPYPVGEFNDLDPNTKKSDWIKNLRPINPYATYQLLTAGLDRDTTRGAITSSVQRDPISSVFGFNSPGRPIPSQDPKNLPDLQQQINQGTIDPNYTRPTTRVPGHSFVMDDGDIQGKNNLVRLKTAAGHQILMNDSEGFIYVSNATGTAWVELTKEGDVLIYNSRDLSIRTHGNIQMHSDRDILFNAGRYFNINAPAIQIQGTQLTSITGKQAVQIHGAQTMIGGKSALLMSSGGPMSLKATGAVAINGSLISLNGGGGAQVPEPKPIPSFLNPESYQVNGQWVTRTNSMQSICYRVPTHEPYVRGNIASVIQAQEQAANEITVPNVTTLLGDTVASLSIPASKNVSDASVASVVDPAPITAFLTQPEPSSSMGLLNKDDYRAYLAQVGHADSNSQLDAVSDYGYLGKYQLDVQSLIDVGYVKPGTPQTSAALLNPNNWVAGGNRPANADEFLASTTFQDEAMTAYTQQNYSVLQTNGVITASTPKDQVAGLLSVAQRLGAQDTSNWYIGVQTQAPADLFTKYYQQGAFSQSQTDYIVSSNQSKTILGAS